MAGSFLASRRPSGVNRAADPFVVALLVALLAHAALLSWRFGVPRASGPDIADLEVDVVPWPESADGALVGPSRVEDGMERVTSVRSSTRASLAKELTEPAVLAGSEATAVAEPDPSAGQSTTTAKATPRPGVRLFLGAGDLNDLVGRPRTTEKGPSNSAALFSEGTGKGSEVGVSASSPAISAGYRAARLAPQTGTAVFEVRTNAAGVVTAVYLLSDDESGAWSGVTEDLLARLGQSALRVPDGSKGMVTRLRIDRGYLAKDLSERGKVTQGVALGQEHHAKDLGWEESTQGSTRPSRLAPVAGVSSESLRHRVPTRVVLLSQEFL